MRLFCIVASKDADRALASGVVIERKNVIKTKQDCFSYLGQIAFKHGGAILLEIHDKIAAEDFEGQLSIDASQLTIIDPNSIGMDDNLIKKAYLDACNHNTRLTKSAKCNQETFSSILKSMNQTDTKKFIKEYKTASEEATQLKIKNGNKAALMTAIKKAGVYNAR
jgi:hypothetical protein